MIEYILNRSKRKTTAIYVRNGVVEVRAPLRAPVESIDRFVASKEKWILSKLGQLQEQSEQRNAFSLNYGDCVLYRGAFYPIVGVSEKKQQGFDGDSFNIILGLTSEEIKAQCINIYRSLARVVVAEKISHYAEVMSLYPDKINLRINNAKSRWGSCSFKSINIAWRIIMAEDDAIDYLVVHELAHIYEMNHGSRFWAIVERVLPDYKMRKQKLRQLQDKQDREDWG